MKILPGTDPSIVNDALYAVLPVMLTIACYSVYWFIAVSGKLRESISGIFNSGRAAIVQVTVKRVAGFLLMGVVPVAVCLLVFDDYSLADAGLWFNRDKTWFTVISLVLLSLVIIPVIAHNARKPEILALYPEIRASRWTGSLLLVEIVTWALYLFGYEVLFRGVLLFGLAKPLGPVAATAVNVILYSAAHIPKGKGETLGAIPFGMVLCVLTLVSGTIWIAFIAHLVNAVTLTFTAIKYNPGMSYAHRGK
ncbi:MAG: CPBP family intramembrane metalloprotease [Bacteroidetes bacterium]|nr:MAG: CPBP family intramembrane metalloprotease [Bacteroidota bacterium]